MELTGLKSTEIVVYKRKRRKHKKDWNATFNLVFKSKDTQTQAHTHRTLLRYYLAKQNGVVIV